MNITFVWEIQLGTVIHGLAMVLSILVCVRLATRQVLLRFDRSDVIQERIVKALEKDHEC